MLLGVLMLNFATEELLKDRSVDEDERQTLYEYCGTSSRCFLTLFELTLGNWVPVTRILHETASEWFGLVIIIYRTIVGEAVLRVVQAIFVFETFRAVQSNDELMIIQKNRQIMSYIAKVKEMFMKANTRDGKLSLGDFHEIVTDPRVNIWLKSLGIEIADPRSVFDLLDDGNGSLSPDEIVRGFVRLRGPATSLDVCQLLKRVSIIESLLTENLRSLARGDCRVPKSMLGSTTTRGSS